MGWFRRNEHDEEQLSAYLDGELSSRQTENVERHLATCNTCTALLEELRDTRALLSALPVQAPPRSFVLGAEYARAPVREVARPSKRFNLALAPAVALSVFVALLFVDLADFSSTSSDESADMFTAATARDNERAAAGSAETMQAPSAAENANSSAESADVTAGKGGDSSGPDAPPAALDGGLGGAVEPTLESAAALTVEEAPTPAPGEAGATAPMQDDSDPALQPQPFEVPDADDDDGGISTLRLLQVLAGLAFLASGIYVFVWPRLSRGGS